MDMDMVVNDVSFLALVFGLVEFAKKLSVRGRALTVLSMVLGVVMGVGYQVAQNGVPTDFAGWFAAGVFGLAVGLAASGIYDFADARWPKFTQPEG